MQLNAGHEVHQRLAPYLSSSLDTPKMRASVKAVNRIYMLRDYSPLTTLLSMLLLPLMLLPTFGGDDVWGALWSQNSPYLPWTQRLFLVSHTILAINTYITFHHVGLSQLSNIQAQDFWAAPCTLSPPTMLSHGPKSDCIPTVLLILNPQPKHQPFSWPVQLTSIETKQIPLFAASSHFFLPSPQLQPSP